MVNATIILCEHGPGGVPALFAGASTVIVALAARDVVPALKRLDAARAQGKWIAGYGAYEAGYALEPRLWPLMPLRRPGPLLCFGVFDAPQDAGAMLARAADEGTQTHMTAPDPRITQRAYNRAMTRVLFVCRSCAVCVQQEPLAQPDRRAGIC